MKKNAYGELTRYSSTSSSLSSSKAGIDSRRLETDTGAV
jgi:hypothetical protein